MERNNNNIKGRKGKHLNYEERQKLEILLKAKHSAKEIAELLGGRSERTIKMEIKRGTVRQFNSDLTDRYEYSAEAGQREYYLNAANKVRGLKIGNAHDLVEYIEEKIAKEKMAPYAALQSIENEGKKFSVNICLKTLYNYIEQGLFLNIGKGDLPQRGKKMVRNYNKIRRSHNNLTGTSITERPAEIAYRRDFGHWELDTVVGKAGTKAVLLVFTERKTRYELIYKLERKTERVVVGVLDRLERKLGKKRFRRIFKTITCDNGRENLDHEGMERLVTKGKRTKVYYA
ncbi:MAG: IS30 family transposase, partial [Christensenellaceae bacterium]|nr:IS30 family transposase [Christensenellaceae bacterium]